MRAKQALKPRRRGAPSLVQAAPRKRRFGFLLKATCVVVILVLTLTLGFMLGAIQSYDDSNPARVPGGKAGFKVQNIGLNGIA